MLNLQTDKTLGSTGNEQSYMTELVVQHNLDAIFLTAPDGRIFSANPAACELFGYTEAEFVEGGRSLISDVNDPEVAALIATRKEHGSVRGEQWMQRKDGSQVRVEVTSAIFELEGEQRTAMIVRDLSLQERYRYLERILDAAGADLPLTFCVTDENWRLLWANPAMEQITGYPRNELLNKTSPLACYLETHEPEKFAHIEKSIKEYGKWSGNVSGRRKSGELYPGRITITAIDTSLPGQRHMVVTLTDASAMQDYEQRLREASFYDPTTGLPNRVLFEQQANEMLYSACAYRKAYYLLIVDIDAFRTINEAHGHKIADQALAKLAQRLRDNLPDHVVIARHTGDSFALLMPAPGELNEMTLTAQQIKQILREPFQVNSTRFALTASIGISNYPHDGRTIGLLLQSAETALQWAKKNGGDGHVFYEPGSEENSRRFIELAAPMREGLSKGEFLAYFQPIVDSRTQCTVAMETLARWRLADGTIMSPGNFIPVAERSGMIDEITATLLRQACQHLRRLDVNGHPNLSTAVNLSARQFSDPQLPQRLLQIITEERISPNRIILEITESLLMENPHSKSILVESLRREGMQVVIDDFGTGYSSFAYLKHFQVDGIKLDRVFVKDVPGQSRDEVLTRMMIALGNELNIPVVAEGVESQTQADFLSSHDCSRIQGYLVAPPLPASEFIAYLDGSESK